MWRAISACVARFKQGIRFKVGCGDCVQFWHDPCCGSSLLVDQFPSLFRLTVSPRGFVFSLYSFSSDQLVWDICFHRNLTDTEIDDFSCLLL